MTLQIVIAGTDTDVGKTIFAAGLTRALDGCYWKPIQAGIDGETDRDIAKRLTRFGDDRILHEAYRLTAPASPHLAAERDGIMIDTASLVPPPTARPLVIEPAGGLAVPLTRNLLQIDLLARWKLPVILVAATRLGTINHSLLSIEALKQRAIPILGVAFIGPENADSQRTICDMGRVRLLGCLPHLELLTAETLSRAFTESFDVADLLGIGAVGP